MNAIMCVGIMKNSVEDGEEQMSMNLFRRAEAVRKTLMVGIKNVQRVEHAFHAKKVSLNELHAPTGDKCGRMGTVDHIGEGNSEVHEIAVVVKSRMHKTKGNVNRRRRGVNVWRNKRRS